MRIEVLLHSTDESVTPLPRCTISSQLKSVLLHGILQRAQVTELHDDVRLLHDPG